MRETVVVSNPPLGGTVVNQTVALLVASLPTDIHVVDFTWGKALFGRYDVLQLHWPEFVVRHKTVLGAAAKKVLFAALLVRLRLFGTKSVWTVHNLHPHEPGGAFERSLLRWWDKTVSTHVYLYSAAIPADASPNFRVIKRGDYTPTFATLRDRWRGERVANRLLLFGLLRPYKGVEALIAATADGDASGLTFRVAGEPNPPSYGDSLVSLAAGCDAVQVQLGHMTDEELANEVLSSDAVILPYLHMYNSGAALLALTLGRPVVVPASPTMRELREEVGSEWVYLYEGALSGRVLRQIATGFLTLPRANLPDLRERHWDAVGQQYAALYRTLRVKGPGVAR